MSPLARYVSGPKFSQAALRSVLFTKCFIETASVLFSVQSRMAPLTPPPPLPPSVSGAVSDVTCTVWSQVVMRTCHHSGMSKFAQRVLLLNFSDSVCKLESLFSTHTPHPYPIPYTPLLTPLPYPSPSASLRPLLASKSHWPLFQWCVQVPLFR